MIENRVAYTKKVRPTKRKVDSVLWKIGFTHKIIDEINIKAIFNKRDLQDRLPTEIKGKDSFRIIYKYGKSIGSKLLNYNNILKETQELSYDEIEEMTCSCADSPLVNTHHGHIMTGNLKIIEDEGLRNLCAPRMVQSLERYLY